MEGVEFEASPLCRVVSSPEFGRQHLGDPSGGPMDRFGMWTANALLGQGRDTPALEVVHAHDITFTRPTGFVLTGARRVRPRLCRASGDEIIELGHAVVSYAETGDRLKLGTPERGLRTYVAVRADLPRAWVGRARPPFEKICRTRDPENAIRVTPGPEFGTLAAPGALFATTWKVTRDLSDVGIRLAPLGGLASSPLTANPPEITSGPVADGTVQLPPAGPLILMRQRPTLGGYPRIATVIDVDLDRLAQTTPGQAVRFKRVANEEAVHWLSQREHDLAAVVARFDH